MITPEQLAKSGSEHGEQAALFCWAALQETQLKYPELKYMFAIPNGGYRNLVEATRLKAAGVKAGVPDIMLPVKRHIWCGMFIEMKRVKSVGKAKGVVSQDQINFISFLQSEDYCCMVCEGWKMARDRISAYLDLKYKW